MMSFLFLDSTKETTCHIDNIESKPIETDTCYFTMSFMFLIQLGAGVGGIALLSHGITYIDDNVTKRSSPALIGESYQVE